MVPLLLKGTHATGIILCSHHQKTVLVRLFDGSFSHDRTLTFCFYFTSHVISCGTNMPHCCEKERQLTRMSEFPNISEILIQYLRHSKHMFNNKCDNENTYVRTIKNKISGEPPINAL